MSELKRKNSVSWEELTESQKLVFNSCLDWYKRSNKEQLALVDGYAGTGKTTIIKLLVEHFHKLGLRIQIGSYTGKAAQVLRKKGLNASTIHSMIYQPIEEDDGSLSYKLVEDLLADLIIIDEYSMVSDELLEDLIYFKIPILFFGDSFQLPPIRGQELRLEPIARLTEIVRQSGLIAQLGGRIRADDLSVFQSYGRYADERDEEVLVIKREDLEKALEFYQLRKEEIQILCMTNKRRREWNEAIRHEYYESKDTPQVGERLICLKNIRELGLVNGSQLIVKESLKESREKKTWKPCFRGLVEIEDTKRENELQIDAEILRGESFENQLKYPKGLVPCDYAYCITVHKSQGSEWDVVILDDDYPERLKWFNGDNYQRWLYTAITRAKKVLIYIKNE